MTDYNKGEPPTAATVVDFPDAESLPDQAAKWVARLDADQPSAATKREFKHWLQQSPEHRREFEKHLALWGDMNILATMVPPARQQAQQTTRSPRRWLTPAPVAFAMGLLLVILLQFNTSPNHYRTEIGEQQQVELDDGTMVLLNTNTELRVAYTDQRRTIYLSKGEAHFEVAHNPERPFEVHAGQGKVRAVGTAFTVYLKSDDVEVVVTEGEIAILPAATATTTTTTTASKPTTLAQNQTPEPNTSAAPVTARVKAGGVATYDRHTAEHVMLEALGDEEHKLSWREGMLVFRSEPLSRVIAEVNRYTPLNIIIPDPAVRAIKVGGFFKVSEIDSVFDALEKGFDIRAEYISEDVVYLVHRAP
ncbi:FecR family protein [Oceanicoccus sagamiensis]|uniref:FecR protein domain-containing protein n=1 Tax=Oceanicoccus sagamiensis TaxID=716816 RepID=A0A1X9N9N7_9GAMM|nr:FecR domain-containing protein [Oceanicoccus sagamiensis]ARN73794.1 hypothetical protein BST96_06505 [Oceanicoccus sagamiensis]